jgi:hypothetical protein
MIRLERRKNITTLLPCNSTEATVYGLTPYTSYEYSIAAHTAVGIGPFTNIYSIKTLEAGKCNG